MRAVMFHQGALGDFLLAVSAMEGWCARRPGLKVDFWSKPEHVSLLAGKEYLGDFHPLDGPLIPSLLHESLWKSVKLPEFLLSADHVFIFGQEGTRIMAERLSKRTVARVDWVRSFPGPEHGGSHVLDFLHGQLREFGPCTRSPGTMQIRPHRSNVESAKTLLNELGFYGNGAAPVLVHPGSGGVKKIWPLGEWHKLLYWMEANSIPVMLSVGPADERVGEFCRKISGAKRPVVSGVSPARLSALLSMCRLYIGSDSGVSHLAAASGTPSVVIFGPSDPDVWGPAGGGTQLLRRSWREGDVFDWDPGYLPETPDLGVVEKVRELLADGQPPLAGMTG